MDISDIRKEVLRLALPSVAEQMLFMVVGIVSTIFVGHISKEAISAVGLINSLIGFIMVVFVALTTGCTVIVARLIGEQEIEKASQVVKQCTVLGSFVAIVLSIVCYILSKPIVNLFFPGTDAQIIHLAIIYFKISLYTFPLALINIIVSGGLKGAGDTKTPMYIANIVNIVNILLSYMLIFGINLNGISIIKGFGVTGAAYAVAISRGIGGILSIVALYKHQSIIKVNVFERFSPDTDIIKRVLKVGIPASLEQLIMQGGFLLLQSYVSHMGTVVIAVYLIAMSISSISFIPMWGIGIAATTLVGQNLGARKPEFAETYTWYTLKIGLFITIILTSLIFIFSAQLVAVYNSDPEVINAGALAINIFSISQLFISVVVIISSALRGAGDITYVMLTSFVGIWVFRIALTIGLYSLTPLGSLSIWVAYIADFLIRSIMYVMRFRRGRWKDIAI